MLTKIDMVARQTKNYTRKAKAAWMQNTKQINTVNSYPNTEKQWEPNYFGKNRISPK
jgi:hypothetical protein